MSKPKNITAQWIELQVIYEGLTAFDFTKNLINYADDRVSQMQYVSTHFVMVLGVDRLMEEISIIWLSTKNRLAMPDPLLGICYFSDDIESLIARYAVPLDLLDRHKTNMCLYAENSSFILNNDWVTNSDFLNSLEALNEWMWKRAEMLGVWEYERKLNGLRIKQGTFK